MDNQVTSFLRQKHIHPSYISTISEEKIKAQIDPLSYLIEQTNPIDLLILLRILHKKYPEAGRKAGAIKRYIKHFKETFESDTEKTKETAKKIQNKLNKLST